jgi:hypothetical protein
MILLPSFSFILNIYNYHIESRKCQSFKEHNHAASHAASSPCVNAMAVCEMIKSLMVLLMMVAIDAQVLTVVSFEPYQLTSLKILLLGDHSITA